MKKEKRITTVDIGKSLSEKLHRLNDFYKDSEIIKDIEQGKYPSPTYQSNEHLSNMEKEIVAFNQTTNELYQEIKNIKAEMTLKEQENKKQNWKLATYSAIVGGIASKIIDLLF